MVKYKLEYTDTVGNEYVCEIYDDNYEYDPILVGGYCVLDYPKIKNIYQVIRGSGLRIFLEASTYLTLEDLYNNGEKENRVTLKRNGDFIFYGFIDPAGLSEDLVNDVWEVTLDCVDGLALLEDLSYVNPNGAPFTGVLSDIEVIFNCLYRTGLTLGDGLLMEIRTSINTRYETRDLNTDPLFTTYSNQERFYKDDGETIMSCKEVLESTLRKYGGCIMQAEGVWNIFSFYELLSNTPRLFTSYYFGNIFVGDSSIDSYETLEIKTFNGSNLDDVHFVKGNARKEIIAPVGAVKVNYKYGFANSVISNFNFVNDGTIIYDWEIVSNEVVLHPSGIGYSVSTERNQDIMVRSIFSDVVIDIPLKISTSFDFDVQITGAPPYQYTRIKVQLRVKLVGESSTEYWIDDNLEWVQTNDYFARTVDFGSYSGFGGLDLDLPTLPENGDIQVEVLRFDLQVPDVYEAIITMRELKIFPSVNELIEGETHTQQIEGGNTRVEDVIEVNVGDTPSDIYSGALYKDDEVTNTDFWATIETPIEEVSEKSILEILSEQIARYRRNPTYLINTDVFGYFNPLKLITLDVVNGRTFITSGYSLDTKENVNTVEFTELRDGGTDGLTYEFALDYGNVQKPTIIG